MCHVAAKWWWKAVRKIQDKQECTLSNNKHTLRQCNEEFTCAKDHTCVRYNLYTFYRSCYLWPMLNCYCLLLSNEIIIIRIAGIVLRRNLKPANSTFAKWSRQRWVGAQVVSGWTCWNDRVRDFDRVPWGHWEDSEAKERWYSVKSLQLLREFVHRRYTRRRRMRPLLCEPYPSRVLARRRARNTSRAKTPNKLWDDGMHKQELY